MTSIASCFSVSGTLIRENLRRFWALPVLSFIVYFLSGVFPILLQRRDLSRSAHMIESMLENQQFFFMAVHLMAPIIAAVALYKYLQGVSSVAIMHSMPFTRQKLFNSSFVSGLILILAPIIATGIILLCLSTPVYFPENTLNADAVNVFSVGAILNWVWSSALIVCVLFAVAVFAGIVTGNTPLHFIMALFFNFLIPGLYGILTWYCGKYLFGFTSQGSWTEIGMGISPYLNVIDGGGAFTGPATVWYICVFAALAVICSLLYRRRKLERAGDAFTFGFMAPVIEFLLAYMMMTLLGFYFEQMMGDEIFTYLGYAGGAVLGFLIGRMVTQKTFRIFNGASLKNFLIYVMVALVFFAVMGFDLTGFEKRVPTVAKVESVAFTNGVDMRSSQWDTAPLAAPENLAAMEELHRSITEDREYIEDFENGYTIPCRINYTLQNGGSLNRDYRLPYTFIRENQAFASLLESPEYKGEGPFAEQEGKELTLRYASFNSRYSSGGDRMELLEHNKAELQELRRCITADYFAMSFEDQISLALPYGTVEVEYSYSEEEGEAESAQERRADYRYYSLNVRSSSANTLQWLREQGYGDMLTLKPEDVAYATVIQVKDGERSWIGEDEGLYYEKYGYTKDSPAASAVPVPTEEADPALLAIDVPKQEAGRLVTTDWSQIQQVLNLAESRSIDNLNHYYVTVRRVGENGTIDFHLNEDRVPDFITAYFE